MPVSEEYARYIRERLEIIGPIFIRRMFGSLGIYCDTIFFALVSDNVLYFKVDEFNRADFEDAGMGPFLPYDDESRPMQYYEVPADVLENDDILVMWAEKALAVARRSKTKKPECITGKRRK